MRNLKRVLALALALVMTLGLMITASAASYADADQIDANYNEAIEVLTNMGVFRGQDNGGASAEFAPKDILTRAEAATLVYRLLTADVTDAKTSNYDYTSFDDVKEGEWWTGYITYAANGKYVVGYGNGKFGPNDQVTGIEVLTIMLRALGYGQNGEFVGGGWKDHVVTTANENGMLKGVATNDLDKGASRELVAQLLFNAITAPSMVNYAPLTGYSKTNQTLGEKNFGLVEIEGVVTANEYADLDDDEAQAPGKTVIGGKTYNISTEVTDIGESRRGWATGKDVLFLTDSGLNTVWENAGAATVLYDGKKDNFKKVTGLTNDAEEYINFARDDESLYETDIRIVYDTDPNDAVDPVSIKAGATLKQSQYNEIKAIFTDDDLTNGWVVVGTKYNAATAEEDDISNDITFKSFVKEYLTATSESTTSVDGADNGEWLKVIDNDNDGVADYVFRVDFTMTTITDIDAKKGTYTFEDNTKLSIKQSDVVTEDELVEGDVILYTYIDGVYYVSIPEIAVETIDKKGIDYKAETITCGDNTYEWSGINYKAYDYYHDISEASTEESYDLYLDHFGYVRLFTESAYNKGFVLLLDGYYETDRRTDGYKAEIWNVEDEKSEDVVVLEGKGATLATTFIDNGVLNGRDDEGTWSRLKEAGQVYFGDTANTDPFVTNIAAYSVNDDGEYTLTKVQNAANKVRYDAAEIALTSKSTIKDRTLTNAVANELPIQTTTQTLYYYVLNPGEKNQSITTWVGYANAPKTATLGENAIAYAVTTQSSTGKYDIAEIVVIETKSAVSSTVNFAYALSQKLIGENYLDIYALGYDEDNEVYGPVVREGKVTVPTAKMRPYPTHLGDLIEFYTIKSNKTVELINENYDDYNIYAGYVTVAEQVKGRDYVQVSYGDTNKTTDFYTDTTPSYIVTYNEKAAATSDSFLVDGYSYTRVGNVRTTYDVQENTEFSAGYVTKAGNVVDGDRVIFVTDNKGNVLYVINVDESVYGKDDTVVEALGDFTGLWSQIMADYSAPEAQPIVTFYDVPVLADANGKFELIGTNAVSYAAAEKAEVAFKVTNGKVVITTDNLEAEPDVNGDTYAGTILGTDGKYYTFELVQAAARSTAKLYLDDTTTEATSADLDMPADKYTIQEYVDQFDVAPGANIKWSFVTSAGTPFSFTGMTASNVPFGVTTDEIASVTAVVTAEDGTTKTYKDTASAANADLIAAIDDAVEDLNDFIAPLADSVGTDAESYISGSWLDQPLNGGSTNTLYNVVNKGFADINAETVTGNVANQLLVAEYNTVNNTGVVAINNLIRLVGGGTGSGTSFKGTKYWNNTIDAAFDAAYTDIMTAIAAVATDPAKALDDIIDAYETAFAAIQDNILNTEPVYQAHFWVASDKGNVQIALMRYNDAQGKEAGTWLSQAEIEALNLTAAEFTVTLNGTDYPAKKIVSYLSSGDAGVTNNAILIANSAGVVKINIGTGVFTSGQTLNLDYDGTKTGNVTFALDFATLDVDSFGGTISVP